VALVEAVPGRRRITVGGDKAYDTRELVQSLRALRATPHVAQNNKNRRSAIDGRTTRHPGYAVSQRLRKRVEEIFGWMKTVGNLRKTRHRGQDRVGFVFTLTAAAYNLVRMRNLLAEASS
jgi:IS5 family transposase